MEDPEQQGAIVSTEQIEGLPGDATVPDYFAIYNSAMNQMMGGAPDWNAMAERMALPIHQQAEKTYGRGTQGITDNLRGRGLWQSGQAEDMMGKFTDDWSQNYLGAMAGITPQIAALQNQYVGDSSRHAATMAGLGLSGHQFEEAQRQFDTNYGWQREQWTQEQDQRERMLMEQIAQMAMQTGLLDNLGGYLKSILG